MSSPAASRPGGREVRIDRAVYAVEDETRTYRYLRRNPDWQGLDPEENERNKRQLDGYSRIFPDGRTKVFSYRPPYTTKRAVACPSIPGPSSALTKIEYSTKPRYLKDPPHLLLQRAQDDATLFRQRRADPDEGMEPRGIHEIDPSHVDHEPPRTPADHRGQTPGEDPRGADTGRRRSGIISGGLSGVRGRLVVRR